MKVLSTLFSLCVAATALDTIVNTAADTPSLSTLVGILGMNEYKATLDLLNGAGPFTVFAPTNDAFKVLTDAGLDVSTQTQLVSDVLAHHVISGAAVKSTDLASAQFPETVLGKKLGVYKHSDGRVTINYGVPGSNTVTVSIKDVECTNGVVHVVDTVIQPPLTTSQTASSVPALSELVAALTKAGLVDAVDTSQGTTIFAPTNSAMNAANWKDLSDADLGKVLKYHVVTGGATPSIDVPDTNTGLDTLEGSEVTVISDGSTVKVNTATVAIADVLTDTGVVHVIDKVLIPESITKSSAPALNPFMALLVSSLLLCLRL